MSDVVSQLFDLIEDGDEPSALAILEHNPSLADSTFYGQTLLNVAVEQDHESLVVWLLHHGANPSRRGNNGRTALHTAALGRSLDVSRLLVEHGADLEAVDDHGHTPLLTAAYASEFEVADVLIEGGANVDIACAVALGRTDLARRVLEEDEHAVTNSRFRDSLLSNAVLTHNPELVELLLQQPGIDVNAVGDSGATPLVAAVSRNDYSPEIVALLIKHGADPNLKSSSGDTAFVRAASVGISNVEDLFARTAG